MLNTDFQHFHTVTPAIPFRAPRNVVGLGNGKQTSKTGRLAVEKDISILPPGHFGGGAGGDHRLPVLLVHQLGRQPVADLPGER